MSSDSSPNVVREFEKLINPVSASDFFDGFFGQTAMILNRAQSGYYDRVVTLHDLNTYFSQSPFAEEIHVMDEGRGIHSDKWTTVSKDSSSHRIDAERLWNQIRMGRSIRIQSAQKKIPVLKRFCAGISHDLRFPVNANIYITPPSAKALDVHYDTHDVLVLQISGTKAWTLYDTPVALPGRSQPFDRTAYEATEPSNSFELSPGDLLYLPRGLVHSAASTDTTSVHVSLGLHYKVAHDLISELAVKLQSDETFRHALPHGYSSEQERDDSSSTINNLFSGIVQETDFRALLDEIQQANVASIEDISQHTFSQVLSSPILANGAVLQKKAGVQYTLTQEKDRFKLHVNDDTIYIPNLFQPLLDKILGDTPFKLSDCQILATEKTKLDLAKRLLDAGLLEFGHEPDAAG